VGNQLDRVLRQESLHYLRGVNRRVVPVKESLPGNKFGPFLPERLQESPQGINDVGRVDRNAPGDVIRIHHALILEKRKHHLLGTCGGDFGLDRAWRALFSHCMDWRLVSGVCMETALSSFVTILLKMPAPFPAPAGQRPLKSPPSFPSDRVTAAWGQISHSF
jgi:hypothetical protein